MLVFEERRKPEYLEQNLSEQRRETNNKLNAHMALTHHLATLFFRREVYAPINVNPVGGWGGEGVRARGGDLSNFEIFGSNSPGWETKGRSKVSKKPPPQGKKSKQTIL